MDTPKDPVEKDISWRWVIYRELTQHRDDINRNADKTREDVRDLHDKITALQTFVLKEFKDINAKFDDLIRKMDDDQEKFNTDISLQIQKLGLNLESVSKDIAQKTAIVAGKDAGAAISREMGEKARKDLVETFKYYSVGLAACIVGIIEGLRYLKIGPF